MELQSRPFFPLNECGFFLFFFFFFGVGKNSPLFWMTLIVLNVNEFEYYMLFFKITVCFQIKPRQTELK